MKQNPVVHFEMSVADGDRASEFYSKAFGWHMNKLGEDMGGYILAATTDTDDKGMVQTPGTINGGLYKRDGKLPVEPSVVVQVDDIKEAMERVKEAGGKLLGEPMDIPGVGTYVPIRDTEGNRVGMLQPVAM